MFVWIISIIPIKRYARTYFVIKIVNCPVCSWSRKLRSLEDSMAIYRCQAASQISLFVVFLISWISLPTKTTKIGTPRIKAISQYNNKGTINLFQQIQVAIKTTFILFKYVGQKLIRSCVVFVVLTWRL